ncbi:MAG TPA: regulatory protein RecX [Streptosporangiaceae bacterium]|nr:regulatory protein RecX [Streptosporangiaceae bacterium]
MATRRRASGRAVGAPGGPGKNSNSAGAPDAPAVGVVSGSAPGGPSLGADSGSVGASGGPEAVARQICLRMLTAAPRTRAQLADALRRRGVPDDVAEEVLGRFADVKLIDDAMFATAWVESRHHGRGLSGRALAAELRHRGVGSEDIQAAVGHLAPEQEIATARSLVARKLAVTRGQPVPARMRRLVGVLARKGYSPSLAYRVAREALEQEGVDLAMAGVDLTELPDEPAGEMPGGEFAEP